MVIQLLGLDTLPLIPKYFYLFRANESHCVITTRTKMHSNTQVFLNLFTTLRTLLTCTPAVDLRKKLIAFPAYVLKDVSELPKTGVKHRLT